MFLPIEETVFADGKDRTLEATAKVAIILNRLFIPSHVAVDFLIVDARVKPKEGGGEVPLFAGEGPVHAVTFSETSFGHTPLEASMAPGDVVELTVRCIAKVSGGAHVTRTFWAAWDGKGRSPAG